MNSMTNVDATTDLASAEDRAWDVLVVGAGVAGATAARGLAQRGRRVLLVDKATFPRWKVCGCCLNGAALASLAAQGLGDLPARCGAPRLMQVEIACGRGRLRLDLPAGVALSRERLDVELVRAAVDAGAAFLPGTRARWAEADESGVVVELGQDARAVRVRAARVVAADGLNAGFTRHVPGVTRVLRGDSRIGAGATAESLPACQPGTIHMIVGAAGYVGLVRLEDGPVDLAAALEPSAVTAAGGLAPAVGGILASAGVPGADAVAGLRWVGTPPLTRRHTAPADARVFLAGDAAEYVEPFTGEGMAWALQSGAALAVLLSGASAADSGAVQVAWQQTRRRLLAGRQWRCAWLTRALRHPWLTRGGIALLSVAPQLSRPYLRGLNAPTPALG
jgi:flavin-dependent dehydrogenase